MAEPVDLSGLDFAVDMMRNPSPQQLELKIKHLTFERDAYFDFIVKLGYAPADAFEEAK